MVVVNVYTLKKHRVVIACHSTASHTVLTESLIMQSYSNSQLLLIYDITPSS
jgi:hypothetical protein